MNRKNLLILGFALMLGGTQVWSQTRSDSLLTRDLLLEKDFTPQVEHSGKVFQMPETESLKTNRQSLKFATGSNLLTLDNDYVPMRPAEARVNFPHQDYSSYARLATSGLHFLADGQWNILHQERQRLELLMHSRVQERPFFTEPQRAFNNHSQLLANYQYHFNCCALTASLEESYRSWNYAINGLSRGDDGVPGNSRSSDTRLSLGIASKPWDKDFNYHLHADGHIFYLDRPDERASGQSERSLDMRGGASYHIGDNWLAQLDVDARYLSYSASTHLTSLFWFDIKPQATYSWRLWDFSLGAHLSSTLAETNSFKFAAMASAKRGLGEKAAFCLSLDGGERLYSYRESFKINPYLDFGEKIASSYSPVHLNADLQWNPIDMLQIRAEAGYQYLQNLAQFSPVRETSAGVALGPTFGLSYLDSHIMYIGSGADFSYGQLLRLSGDIRFQHFDKQLCYLPAWTLNMALELRPTAKLSLSANYFAALQRYMPSTAEGSRLKMNDFHYWQACLSYQLTRQWDIFAQYHPFSDTNFAMWNSSYSGFFPACFPLVGASFTF